MCVSAQLDEQDLAPFGIQMNALDFVSKPHWKDLSEAPEHLQGAHNLFSLEGVELYCSVMSMEKSGFAFDLRVVLLVFILPLPPLFFLSLSFFLKAVFRCLVYTRSRRNGPVREH